MLSVRTCSVLDIIEVPLKQLVSFRRSNVFLSTVNILALNLLRQWQRTKPASSWTHNGNQGFQGDSVLQIWKHLKIEWNCTGKKCIPTSKLWCLTLQKLEHQVSPNTKDHAWRNLWKMKTSIGLAIQIWFRFFCTSCHDMIKSGWHNSLYLLDQLYTGSNVKQHYEHHLHKFCKHTDCKQLI